MSVINSEPFKKTLEKANQIVQAAKGRTNRRAGRQIIFAGMYRIGRKIRGGVKWITEARFDSKTAAKRVASALYGSAGRASFIKR